ncbi:EamA family transporter [Actinoallomurus iriomotensis]|uniref:Membrane protein n=1 Tax=Actinoallomurus iriomotensis TaxID=478107 RepID=A0A9W6VR36_9ACTN|nr:EamA family transporter [Actinoallomurus iriomotensis]GLY81788.1 membrane protein [Actinoallomurus iriomotensis]GLY92134.1 membrane protein [Actinoallomurus iriomotensis]
MALADAQGSYGRAGWFRTRAGALRPSLGSVPPPALILLGIVSVQIGAGLAKNLFARSSPDAVVMMRLLTSAVVLGVAYRSSLRDLRRLHSWRDIGVAALFGLTLAGMNACFYQALARLPLGIAVTVEFLGPLSVSILASRRRLDLLWALLALGGVTLLARGNGDVTLTGVAFALLAAAGWAFYILLSGATGRRFAGSSGLAVASIVGAAVMLPVGVGTAGTKLLDPELLLVAAGVGLLSSVIPYTLELEALRRMSARLFGILMSIEPAVAAVVGLVFLGEMLYWREWLAIGLVITACVGATRFQQSPPEAPEA